MTERSSGQGRGGPGGQGGQGGQGGRPSDWSGGSRAAREQYYGAGNEDAYGSGGPTGSYGSGGGTARGHGAGSAGSYGAGSAGGYGAGSADPFATKPAATYGAASAGAYGPGTADAYGAGMTDAYGAGMTDAYGAGTADAYGAGVADAGLARPGVEPSTAGVRHQAMGSKGFLSALFDWGFTSFVTPKVIKVLYVLIFISTLMGALAFTIAAFRLSPIFGLLTLVIGDPLFIIIVMAIYRIILEFFVVIFRVAEDIRAIRERGGGIG
jgi:hypothetical protein